MGLEQWGPPRWQALHSNALNASMNLIPITSFYSHVSSLAEQIPCYECKSHFKKILNTTPPESMDPFTWSVVVHNQVNSRLGKQTLTTEEAFNLYKNSARKLLYTDLY